MCLSIALHRPEDVLAKGRHLDFEWVVVHNGMGFRCGYVRLPKGHPWHSKVYDDIGCEVHGGLTFAEKDEPCDAPGEDDAYWIGFDCAHYCDAPDPALSISFNPAYWPSGEVRTEQYVEKECRSLCEQAALAAASANPARI